jgi:soluble lytic murein transglycosylase-like protein
MPTAALLALARDAAAQHALDPALVCAIVEQESAWDPHAIRYEPAFRQRYVARLGLPPTEEIARSISWGLMQVMGQVAREHGFASKFLAALCDPATALDVGCTVFAAKLRAANNTARLAGPSEDPGQPGGAMNRDVIVRALALWNGGANAAYAAQVLARLANYQ